MRHSSDTHPLRPKGDIKSLRMLAQFLAPYRLAVFGALVSLLFTSFAVLGVGHVLRYMVDEGLSKGNPGLLDEALWLMLGVTTLLALATYCRYYLISWVGERVVADLRNSVYRHLVSLDVTFFETHRTGDILSTLTTDTTLLQTVVGSSVSVALRHFIMMIGGTVMLFFTSTKLTLCVFIILPVVLGPILVLGKRVRQLSRESQNRVGDISSHAEETMFGIRTIQALTLEGYEKTRFDNLVSASLGTALLRIRTRAFLTAIVIGLVFGSIVTVLWIGGHDVLQGTITPGDLSAFIFYSVVVAGSLGAISEIVGELQRAAGATERITELLNACPSITAPTEATQIHPEYLHGNIVLQDVTFCYPSRPETPALQGFSLDIPAGKTIAIVGPSGAGKTTVFQLLLRFYDPQTGNILIDGHNIRHMSPEYLRSLIALVPQDPVIFSANAWDNIRCGDTTADDNAVLEAAKSANALDFLAALPEGLGTYLGEKGVRLSGGQRQRIAIARAIIRNPRILLLDEATSALDAENETMVQAALERLMMARTTLVIAHRLSTVQKADMIVVVDDGKIQATGTHQQLLSINPLYARLAKLQFQTSAE